MTEPAPDIGTALEQAAAPQDKRNVFDLIGSMEGELIRSLQSPEAAAILARHYTNAIRYNETLRQCTPESLVGALLLSAQVRLEPGPLGHVYLVPFRNTKRNVFEVTWMLGYTGIIELGRRGGAAGLRSTVVWDCDEYVEPWEDEKGEGIHYKRKPGPVEKQTERIGVLVTWRDGKVKQAVHCPPSRVATALAHRKAKDDVSNEDWYWRKTGVRFARPWLPLSTEFALADRSDDGIVHGVEAEEGEAFPVVEAEAIEAGGEDV
jgi:recombination protein RecT